MITPILERAETSLVLGLRAKLDFCTMTKRVRGLLSRGNLGDSGAHPATDTLQGLREFALISVFFITGCRVSAIVAACVVELAPAVRAFHHQRGAIRGDGLLAVIVLGRPAVIPTDIALSRPAVKPADVLLSRRAASGTKLE